MASINIKIYLTFTLCVLTLLLYLFGLIPALNAILLPFFSLGLYALSVNRLKNLSLSYIVWIVTFILGFFIAVYRPESFSYPLIWQISSLYPQGDTYFLFANTSKAVGGYLVIIWMFSKYGALEDALNFKRSFYIAVSAVILIILVANLFFGITWQFKLNNGIFYFIIVNLGVTVVAEEAFFRLLLQVKIASFFQNILVSKIISISVVAIFFALSHASKIGDAFFLYLIAGCIYATVYAVSGRLSVSIAVHFSVNILQFILLQYPIPSDLG